MKDPRLAKLAERPNNLLCRAATGRKILLEVIGDALPLAAELIKTVYAAGGVPFLKLAHPSLTRELLKEASAGQLQAQAKWDRSQMEAMQAYIGIRAGRDTSGICGPAR